MTPGLGGMYVSMAFAMGNGDGGQRGYYGEGTACWRKAWVDDDSRQARRLAGQTVCHVSPAPPAARVVGVGAESAAKRRALEGE